MLLTITPDGVRRPVAVSALAMLMALSHRLITEDRLTRAGHWNEKDVVNRGVIDRPGTKQKLVRYSAGS